MCSLITVSANTSNVLVVLNKTYKVEITFLLQTKNISPKLS